MIPGETDAPTRCDYCAGPIRTALMESSAGHYIGKRCQDCLMPYARLTSYFPDKDMALTALRDFRAGKGWMLR